MTTSDASPPPQRTDPVRLPRGRRYTVRALLVLATILTVAAIVAVWANRQVLNADNWADTSTALLENQDVRTQVSAYVVDQIYANVDVQAQLANGLPPRLKPLAGPAAGGLRSVAQETTDRALGRPRVQEAWRRANRLTAQQFINIAESKPGAVTSSGNAVILDLRPVVLNIAAQLGIPRSVVAKIPPDAARIKVMSGDQVTTVQDLASALRGLALVLPPLALALFALAVYLARGRRRETLLVVGFDLIVAGALVLIVRNVAGDSVVDDLVKTDAVKPAAEAVWSIGTGILRDVAQATVIIGIPVVAAAWLAGPSRPAVAFRRAAAPTLRDRPALTYAVVGGLVLLVIAWAPIPAMRKVIPVLILIGLVILAVEALRRQTAAEFPEAARGETWAALHDRAARAERVLRGARTPEGDGRAQATPDDGDRLERLERLSALHDRGALTDEEFAAEKAALVPHGSAT